MIGSKLTEKAIAPLLKGLSLFGTGGGGAPGFGKAIMENDFRQGRRYILADPEDVPDDALIVSGGILGSVKAVDEAFFEDIVARWEKHFPLLVALHAAEAFLGRKVNYIVPFELGGLNTPAILSLGARADIPIIDGDALGRAAPETQMTTFWGHGIPIAPMVMVDDAGNTIIVKDTEDPLFPDRIGRWMVTRAKGMGANIHYPMDGRQLKSSVVPRTITNALEVGKIMSQSRAGRQSAGQKLAELVKGKVLLERGRILNIEERDEGGWLYQNVNLIENDKRVRIIVKNEAMLCFVNDDPVCIFPDLVMMVDPDTGMGVMSSELRGKREISVVLAPCHQRLREAIKSARGETAFSPALYGYKDLEYVPLRP